MLRALVVAVMVSAGCSRAPEREQAPPPAPTPTPAPTPSVLAAPPPPTAAPIASSAPSAEPTAPPIPEAAVDVRAIGMHIGGGPNDDANKAPLLASIAPHHKALGRCWATLPNKPKVELGIDAHVPGKGGRAKVDHPRSTVNDPSFIACAVAVFAGIEFLPPESGLDTTVSTSLRLTPRAF